MTAVITTDGQSSGAPVQIATVVPFADVTNTTMSGGTFTLGFAGIPNTTYELQYTTTLSPASWSNVAPVTTDGIGAGQYVGTPPPGGTGFYRLVHPAP